MTGFEESRVYRVIVRFRVTVPIHTALTSREFQILRRLVEGSTTREIADSYGIAHQTVKNYVTVIYEKLGVRQRSQLLELCRVSDDTLAPSGRTRRVELTRFG